MAYSEAQKRATLKYKRDIAERDARIAELSAKVDEAAKSADSREKLKREIGELLGGGALKDSIDRLEREFGILKGVEDFRAGKLETVPLERIGRGARPRGLTPTGVSSGSEDAWRAGSQERAPRFPHPMPGSV